MSQATDVPCGAIVDLRGPRRSTLRARCRTRLALFEPDLMTKRVKVQCPAVEVRLELDVARNDGLEASCASLAGTLTGPHAPGVVARQIARLEHPSNALA